MKKILCTLLALTIILSVLPAQAFAKSDTVTLYGNKISVHAKRICFVKGSEDTYSYVGSFYDSSFGKYHYVGENTVDLKSVAEKLPELQSLVVIGGGVKNVSALSDLKDLVWLGFYQCSGTEDLSFLKNLTGLKKFRYEYIFAEKENTSIKPLSYLKNLTELYLDVPGETLSDISPLAGLTKLKKLELDHVGDNNAETFKKLKNLRELTVKFSYGNTGADIGFLPYLKKLEYLDITGHTQNINTAAKLKNLKELHIGDTKEDLSFIGEMTQLEKLYLLYTNDTFAPNIGKLKNLKELSLMDIKHSDRGNTSFISKLTSLESLKIFDEYDYGIIISGISKLKKLKHLELAECRFGDLSELKKCTALEEIILDGCKSDFDIKWLEGTGVKDLHISVGNRGSIKNMDRITSLKKLEHLLLFFTGISEQSAKKIKKSLPDCKIEVGEFNEYYRLETKIY